MSGVLKDIYYWVKEIAVAFDQMLNAVLGGTSDETLSSRAHRMRVKRHPYTWWLADVIDAIFFWDDDHCKEAYEGELLRRSAPLGSRE